MKIIRKMTALLLGLAAAAACIGIAYYLIVTGGTRLQPERLQTTEETARVPGEPGGVP